MQAHDHEQQSSQRIKRTPVHEGPRNHIIAFAISIFLTILAFVAVANEALSDQFKVWFILILAIVQVLVQLAFWMHMKDRGHLFPIIGLATGGFIFLTMLATAVYWVWW